MNSLHSSEISWWMHARPHSTWKLCLWMEKVASLINQSDETCIELKLKTKLISNFEYFHTHSYSHTTCSWLKLIIYALDIAGKRFIGTNDIGIFRETSVDFYKITKINKIFFEFSDLFFWKIGMFDNTYYWFVSK